MVRSWLVNARPQGERALGGYEAWSKVMGGILKTAGIPGFLGNLEETYWRTDAELGEWRAFIKRWWERFAEKKVGVGDLFQLALEMEALPGVLGSGNERSQEIRLGKALGRMEGRVIAGVQIKH